MKEKTLEIIENSEKELEEKFIKINLLEEYNTEKVLNAFIENNITEADFNQTTGYGYDDSGRDNVEKVFSSILKAEDSLVRREIISGTHALTITLFGLLRPNDILLSISGKPYDTLDEVIGIVDNDSSLKAHGIKYEQIELINNDFDYEKIKEYLKNNKVKLIEIQRSKGYSTRKSLSIEKVEKVIKEIRSIDKEVIIMIDNCYCEFVSKKEPLEVGADIIAGSLIKNLGGGIAPSGGYVAGRKDLIKLVAERLTAPGLGKEVGPSLGANKQFLQGIFFAPSVVASSLKTALLTSKTMEKLGYSVEPSSEEERVDIVQNIIFNNKEDLIKYCQGIQSASPINSSFKPIPWAMPGYDSEVIMAAGTFTQGSSIELSCDGPIRPPFIAYQQGGLTYYYGKKGITKAIDNLIK